MATDAKKLQPIIIKRVKKGGHAAHGGAWKIAYADFVTAMMAFFLLMWLLGSTSEGDKKGLSDYFQSPLKVAMQGGSGAGASQSVVNGGGNDLTQSAGQSKRGNASDAKTKKNAGEQAKAARAAQDAQKLSELSAKISAIISNTPKLAEFSKQIQLKMTPDGLQIQIVDDQKRPMFDSGSASVKPYMGDILREIGIALVDVDNKISLDGHTDQTPYGAGARGYSNWELSADRANASRRELVASGMPDEKIARVMGLASSVLLDEDNPRSPTNRRISITVMTREAEERLLGPRRAEVITETNTAPVQN
ncbi:flagellar motor protein MotB [Rhodoferax sp.]|uniref:flagellar motor protein MotB n=1 Tax=Rhodoferax sp. TaxID=50421 RepID=UPI002612DC8A|nr:flagellar motor protein MotB [Rhodoferax sp.]MDD4945159.1 flagellar motor protein MotB [Rhodoferax sp.]MDD5478627.1 flagellar motor protein MotB [Rhodoferax sp.]